jgi:hypothetical protein
VVNDALALPVTKSQIHVTLNSNRACMAKIFDDDGKCLCTMPVEEYILCLVDEIKSLQALVKYMMPPEM